MTLIDMRNNIEHVVHLMFENRGFDTLLGWLYADGETPRVNIPKLRIGEQPFHGVPHDGLGRPTVWLPDDPSFYGPGTYNKGKRWINRGNWNRCLMPLDDPGEEWDNVTEQIYGPNRDMNIPEDKRMRGFWLNYKKARYPGVSDPDDILATSTPDDLKVINTLAKSFAVSDTWFSSAPTQTNPNRAFSLGGTSQGVKNNGPFDGIPFDTLRTIFGVLNDTGHSWKLYADHWWMEWDELYFTQYMFPRGMEKATIGSIDQFGEDVRNDRLPVFSYIEPDFGGEATSSGAGTDYHPPGSLWEGETFLQRVYDKLIANPAVFRKTLFIVTFDEHGGTYDHVLPPAAPPPDEDSLDFNRYGVRVPTLLISPWVPPGCVFRAGVHYPGQLLPYDHTSVLKTIMNWLTIPHGGPGDVGWLGIRTSMTSSFEEVITNTRNDAWPRVTPYWCHDLKEGEPRMDVLPSLILRITGLRRGSPELEAIVQRIVATTNTIADFNAHIQQLRREYGDKPHADASPS